MIRFFKIHKFRPTAGIITNDFVLVGFGYSGGYSALLFCVFNLYVGLSITRKFNKK
jgi:hypothetical protein